MFFRNAFYRLFELLQILLFFYTVAAVFYTTTYFVIDPLQRRVSSAVSWTFLDVTEETIAVKPRFKNWTLFLESPDKTSLSWETSGMISDHPAHVYALDEDLFLSKAFSSSLHPSKIVPFFYRASGHFDQEDITITTIITSNRFQVFARLVERYRGPISVTIHVNNDTTHILDLLDSLETLYTSSPQMSRFVDVHLVVDFFDRQFNTWRNIARLFARTDFVMMLDIDFYLCTDFRTAIRNSKPIMEKLREGRAALVIPAFEYTTHEEGADYSTFPKTKEALKARVETKQIDMFHASWAPGHNSTDYERFYAASPGEVYQVTGYQSAYEPYVIFKADGPPWCDERFIGYGGNKAACLYEMYLSGISFYVLADHFLIHQNHAYEETIRKNERKSNKKLYSDFKEETCLKYLIAYHEKGLLNTTWGYNVQQACKNVRSVSKLFSQIISS